uniref:HNH endonuclease signature motif containing protein n=1 Tax=Nocardioides sp. Iso805N TaxID=1283287 RepID=UPI0004769CB8
VGTASLGQTPISAGETRRLACTAAIIPYVLGGQSEPLDLGRARRLFSPAQRKALKIRDQHCRAEGCTVPATWCDAHHENPWSRGGPTDLTNAALLCGHHHRRAHDPTYETIQLPNGDYRYRKTATLIDDRHDTEESLRDRRSAHGPQAPSGRLMT